MRKMLSALVTDTVSSLRRAFSVFPRQYVSLSLSSSHPLSSPPLLCISHFVPVVPLQHLPTESKWKREENPLWIGVALFSPSLSAVWTSGPCCILMLRRDRGVGVGKEGRKRFSLCQSPLKISERKENEFKKTITKKKVGGGGRWNSERDGETVKFLLGILFVLTLMRVPLLSKEASCNNVRLQTVSLSELGIKLASSFYRSTGVCQNACIFALTPPRVHAFSCARRRTRDNFNLLSSLISHLCQR